ncbi:polysaccharide deacetylase family protein [Methanosarcina barkeri]|uniref:polysaccharide deacetylase family protein n=1 Tax=Methanosarcina barkeri TaxID=2208 RepID=UPI000A3F86EC|nr:polysaccharide deacetylase family protein [Methanosarcina barkeri]
MMAKQYPDIIHRIPEEGHELGCHGYTHTRFDRMDKEEARTALKQAGGVLRQFERKLVSFRAPNLQFPKNYLGLLEDEGFRYDSSIAAYKPPFSRSKVEGKIIRIPATITSSFIRLPPEFFYPATQTLGIPCNLCPSLGIRGYVKHIYTPGLQVQYWRKSPKQP